VVGWRYVDVAIPDQGPIGRRAGRQCTGVRQDGRQIAGAVGRDVRDHEHGCGKIGRQDSDQSSEGLDATQRGSDDDNIPVGYDASPIYLPD